MRRSPRTRAFAASVAMVATLGLAACGDDDDDTTPTDDVDVTLSTAGTDDTEITITDETITDVTVTDDTSDGSTPTSGSGEVGSQDDYLAAAKEEIAFEDEDINDCVAEAIVNDDVYAAIQEAGLTVEEFQEDGPVGLGLDEATADDLAGEFESCGDLVPQILADEGEAEVQCAEENLSNEQVSEYLAYSLLGLEPSAEVTAANDAVDTCLDAAAAATTTT